MLRKALKGEVRETLQVMSSRLESLLSRLDSEEDPDLQEVQTHLEDVSSEVETALTLVAWGDV